MTESQFRYMLEKYNTEYYNGSPSISDEEYDKLEKEFKAKYPDSAFHKKVGSPNMSYGTKIKHKQKMYSLDKVHSEEDFLKWLSRIKVPDNITIIAEPKIDGISVSLLYDKTGVLKYAATRGNGDKGILIHNANKIKNIPNKINNEYGCEIEVRGEAYIPKKHHDYFNKGSLRNICGGILRSKDEIKRLKYISFLAYDLIIYDADSNISTEEEKLNKLRALKFDSVIYSLTSYRKDVKSSVYITPIEFMTSYKTILRENYPYETDGVVFTINNCKLHDKINNMFKVDKFRRHHIAYKLPGLTNITKVVDIQYNVSRLGRIIPVCIVEPLMISSVTIARASVYNIEYLKKLNLRYGDKVIIERSNDVIPKLKYVFERSDDKKIPIPRKCPSCKSTLVQDGVHLKCTNSVCRDKLIEKILYWVNALGMKDFGKATIEKMVDKGLLKSIKDIYSLTPESISSIDAFPITGERIKKLMSEIEKSKFITELDIIDAFGIPTIGKKALKRLKISSIKDLIKYKDTKFIENPSYIMEREISKWLNDGNGNLRELIDIRALIKTKLKKEMQLDNGVVCITGTFSKPRTELIKAINLKGYDVTNTVNHKVDFLLCGKNSSNNSKLLKAKKLKIKIINKLSDLK